MTILNNKILEKAHIRRRFFVAIVFLISTAVAIWLGIGATLPIDKSLTLGLF